MRLHFCHGLMLAMAGLLAGTFAACQQDAQYAAQQSDQSHSPVGNSRSSMKILPHPVLARALSLSAGTGGASIADIAEETVGSVVNISTTKVIRTPDDDSGEPFFDDPLFREFFGDPNPEPRRKPRERREQSLGSGVIVDRAGIILTSSHVVEQASEIQVTLNNGHNLKASIVGTDPKSDIAVLKLKATSEEIAALDVIALGDSARLRLGDVVLAIGNPFGVGQTVTMGIVSAKGRANVGIVDYEDFIQTDAAINPGNSGGALVDMEGKLVGINTAILSRSGGYQGIGFAIPSNMAKPLMNSILKHGKVIRGWLGVAIQDLNQDLAAALGIATTQGALVSDIAPQSPAQRAGLRRGDVITSIDNNVVDSSAHLRNMIAAAGTHAVIEISVIRDRKSQTLRAKLSPQPTERVSRGAEVPENQGFLGGLHLRNLDDEARYAYHLPEDLNQGVVVEQVKRDSAAAESGIEPADVILEIDRQPIKSVAHFQQRYRLAKDQLLVLIYRADSTFYLLLTK